jgi:arylsulfatase
MRRSFSTCSSPHIPLMPSAGFRGASQQGTYADLVMEMDWGIGQVLQTLANMGIDQNTLVMFASDHGPWYQGSAGRLRGRKAEVWEGGFRAPFLARWPGTIPGGTVCTAMATAMGLLPTMAGLAGALLPDNPLDGVDIWPLLSGQQTTMNRDTFLYFDGWNLQCARWGRWKLHVARNNTTPWSPTPVVGAMNLPLAAPELYDVEMDACESSDCAADHPDVVAQIWSRIDQVLPSFPAEVQNAWSATMSHGVGYSPAGAMPVIQP